MISNFFGILAGIGFVLGSIAMVGLGLHMLMARDNDYDIVTGPLAVGFGCLLIGACFSIVGC